MTNATTSGMQIAATRAASAARDRSKTSEDNDGMSLIGVVMQTKAS